MSPRSAAASSSFSDFAWGLLPMRSSQYLAFAGSAGTSVVP